MSDDIVERLREYARGPAFHGLSEEAADEIERLRAARSPISQFSDGELRNELHRRAQHFLGDPTKGISFPPSET